MDTIGIILVGVIIVLILYITKNNNVPVSPNTLWLEHVWWTRAYIIEAASKRPTDQIVNRLMLNQTQLANGDQQLQNLLQQHIQIAATLVGQLISNVKNDVLNQTINQWKDNANQIADRLGVQRGMMQDHLNVTLNEAKSIVSGDFQAIKETDKVLQQIMHMGR